MTDSIAGLPFWDVVFDADGDPGETTLLTGVPASGITDLYVFTHGWNNDRAVARHLYTAFFGLLAGQLAAHPSGRPGLAGVYWPARRWSDEPIPDFAPAAVAGGGGGAASARPRTGDAPVPAGPTLDAGTLSGLLDTFPAAKEPLERMASLLAGPVTAAAQAEFLACLREFARFEGTADDDGEGAAGPEPRMLSDAPEELFDRYLDALRDSGASLGPAGDGEAGVLDRLRDRWNGAKEALRAATYWEMKNRAGVVGRDGLGPLLGRLADAAPGVRLHLIGHSFGARLVSYALAGLPDGPAPSPVKSVTLLEGAFSHFAFARPLPFDAGRSGALAGRQDRIDGPLTVCFSRHDDAVGRFYPLASFAARDDAAGAHDPLYRWGAMGADGAQNDDAVRDVIQPAGAAYRFARDRILNVDASEVVRRGGPPSGAHSDIVHPELTWIVLAASRAGG